MELRETYSLEKHSRSTEFIHSFTPRMHTGYLLCARSYAEDTAMYETDKNPSPNKLAGANCWCWVMDTQGFSLLLYVFEIFRGKS